MAEEQALPRGTLLGNRYRIEQILGIGGFGITYKAFDNLYQKICAVKEFAPSGLAYRKPGELDMCVCSSQYVSRYEHGMMRFLEEAQILKRLQNIPSVVHVEECFQENHTAYFAMEFLDGTNLRKIINAAGGNLAVQDVLRIISEVGFALDVIHNTTHIMHRDISPENIYLLRDGSVKLLDFGSARQQMMDEQEYTVEYKHSFAPPEQYSRTGKQGFYTDVYALASTCYYTLTGLRIPDAMERLDGKSYIPLMNLRSDITSEQSDAIDHALELDYRQRTQTMAEFIRQLNPEYADNQQQKILPEKQYGPYLEIISGNGKGIRWNLPSDTLIYIGRSEIQSNIVVPDPMVSKVHCSLVYDQTSKEYLLTDLSKNGVFVDGKRLERGKEYRYPLEVQFSMAVETCKIKAGVFYE